MFNRHLILELPVIPKSKKELQSLIYLTRHKQKKHNMIIFASCNVITWAFYILFVWGPAQHAVNADILQHVYLPLIMQH